LFGLHINGGVQKLIYFLFGTNLVIGPQIKAQIEWLGNQVPSEFKGKALDDLGCGDGKITVRLKEVFQPSQLRGFDVNPGLVVRARMRGIKAETLDLDESLPSGELAMVWGVLHHLRDTEACLQRIARNYPLVFIREPIKNNRIDGFEMGRPLVKSEIEQLAAKYLPDSTILYNYHCIFIFYVSPEYKKTARLAAT
jgi:hypothetical protein